MSAEPAASRREAGGSRGEWALPAERISNAFGLLLLLVMATYVLASLTSYAGWSAVRFPRWDAQGARSGWRAPEPKE
jgi:hypothetical protein